MWVMPCIPAEPARLPANSLQTNTQPEIIHTGDGAEGEDTAMPGLASKGLGAAPIYGGPLLMAAAGWNPDLLDRLPMSCVLIIASGVATGCALRGMRQSRWLWRT